MTPTEEQRRAADKVVECALLMQKCVRDAESLGLDVTVHVYQSGARARVEATVKLVAEAEVARTPKPKD
jgi:hypothetical protein